MESFFDPTFRDINQASTMIIKSPTFNQVLSESIDLQERVLEYFEDLPLLTHNAKSYKEVSEVAQNQLKMVFRGYTDVIERLHQDQLNYKRYNDGGETTFSTIDGRDGHQYSTASLQLGKHQRSQHQNNSHIDHNLKAENEFLKTQLAEVQEELQALNEQKQSRAPQQLIELLDLVKSYEDQMKELQQQLESQIQNEISMANDFHQQLTQQHDLRLSIEAKHHEEHEQIKDKLREFVGAKEELERLTEGLIKKVVSNGQNRSMDGMTNDSSASHISADSFKVEIKQNDNRPVCEIIGQTVNDVKEMGDVVRELTTLIMGILQEKSNTLAQYKEQREQIDMAFQKQDSLTPELLRIKVAILESQLKKLERIAQPTKQKDFEAYSTELIEQQAKMVEKIGILEEQNQSMQKDLETLIQRIEELELENTQVIAKAKSIQERAAEKEKAANDILEQSRVKEYQLNDSISVHFENELRRVKNEVQADFVQQLIMDSAGYLEITVLPHQQYITEKPMQAFKEYVQEITDKVLTMKDKITVLLENKNVLMKERVTYDIKQRELAQVNQQLNQVVSQLQEQVNGIQKTVKEEVSKAIQSEREQANSNQAVVISSLKQATMDLQRLCEEKEYVMIQNIQLKEQLGMLDHLKQQAKPLIKSKSNNLHPSTTSSPRSGQQRVMAPEQVTSPFRGNNQPVLNYQSNKVLSPSALSQKNLKMNFIADRENIRPVEIHERLSYPRQFEADPNAELTLMIRDYKSENQKFSQKVQELQQKISMTGSSAHQDGCLQTRPALAQQQSQRAFSASNMGNQIASEKVNGRQQSSTGMAQKHLTSMRPQSTGGRGLK